MRKLVSLVLVLLLVSALFPAALASSASDAGELKYPTCPVCKRALPDCVCGEKKPAPTATPAPHRCSYGIYEYNGDGTHTAICSGAFFHRYVEKCYSDNNKNHKCDHCAGVMTEHEFSYTPCEPFSHKAVCYCGEEFFEPCLLAEGKCEKCAASYSVQTISGKELEKLNLGDSSLDSYDPAGASADIFNIDFGDASVFRAELSESTLGKLRGENGNIGISVCNDSFSVLMGDAFLDRLDGGVYIDGFGLDDGYGFELGSDGDMLTRFNLEGLSHYGKSSITKSLFSIMPDNGTDDENTKLFSFGFCADGWRLSPTDSKALDWEMRLSKARYTNNTEDYPFAKTEFERIRSGFEAQQFPTATIQYKLSELPASEYFYIIGSEGSSYSLAPNEESIFESSMILNPGREICIYAASLGMDYRF